MAPALVGIIAASFSTRGLIERFGRRLVAAGLTAAAAGAIPSRILAGAVSGPRRW